MSSRRWKAKAAGCEITEIADKAPFQNAVKQLGQIWPE